MKKTERIIRNMRYSVKKDSKERSKEIQLKKQSFHSKMN